MAAKSEDRISVRIDPELKKAVQHELNEMGLDLTTFITMSFKEIQRTHTLPFTPTNLSPLEQSLNDLRTGNLTKPVSVDDYLNEVNQYNEN